MLPLLLGGFVSALAALRFLGRLSAPAAVWHLALCPVGVVPARGPAVAWSVELSLSALWPLYRAGLSLRCGPGEAPRSASAVPSGDAADPPSRWAGGEQEEVSLRMACRVP